MRSALSSPWLAVTLPGTTVMARTSSSGEFERKHQRQRVVGARIGIEDDLLGRAGRRQSLAPRSEGIRMRRRVEWKWNRERQPAPVFQEFFR